MNYKYDLADDRAQEVREGSLDGPSSHLRNSKQLTELVAM
jgi:hypothetical protein